MIGVGLAYSIKGEASAGEGHIGLKERQSRLTEKQERPVRLTERQAREGWPVNRGFDLDDMSYQCLLE